MAPRPTLLAVPNVSEGRDRAAIGAIGGAFEPARVLDIHSDADHGRSVYSLAGRQGELASCLVRGAGEALRQIDLRRHAGLHPHVGAVDVLPVVYLRESDRGAACAEALTAAALLGRELELPVFLYGELATAPERGERAALREGGAERLAARVEAGELAPDQGPERLEPRSGAVLVTARPPLVAFNVELVSEDREVAGALAAELRESGGGLPGIRAIGLFLPGRGRAQISMNVHDPARVPLGEIVRAVADRSAVHSAEIVGLVPHVALDGFPEEVPIVGFAPDRQIIENALRWLE